MRKSRLSWPKQERLIEHFIAGATARTAASLVGVNKTTASFYFHRLRLLIFENYDRHELFESNIGPSINSKFIDGHILENKNKKVVFLLIRLEKKVFIEAVPDSLSTETDKKTKLDRTINTQTSHSLGATSISKLKYYRNKHSSAPTENKISETENFWNHTQRYLQKFNGIPKEHSLLYLRECEWRFNLKSPKEQLTQLKQWVGTIRK